MRWLRRLTGLAAIGAAACNGQVLDVGGGGSSSGASNALGTPPPAATSCTFSGANSDGSGYRSGVPTSCTAADGQQHAFASADEVRSALVGTYYQCTSGLGQGITFTSDGHFADLQADALDNFVPVTTADGSGTFDVVDASATLGPGTFELRLTRGNGGVSLLQVIVYDAPTKVRLVTPIGSPSPTDYAPALTWKFRAGVCGAPFGPYHTFSDVTDVAKQIAGTWIWCEGPSLDPRGTLVGLTFTADGTTEGLYDDGSGQAAPAPATAAQVTFSLPGNGGPSWAALQNYPSTPNVTTYPSMFSVDECGQGMRWFGQTLPGLSPGATEDASPSQSEFLQDYRRVAP